MDEGLLRGTCRDVQIVPLAWATLSSANDLVGRLRSVAGRPPYAVKRFASWEMRERIRTQLDQRQFDAVVCDVFTAINLPDDRLPIVLNNENVEHVILRRYLDRERNPAKVAYAWLEHRKMKRWEREVCARSTVAMACSAIDQDVLQALCPTLPITIVPNVVDLDPFDTDVREDPLTILFQGGMDWYPNRDAVQFFTRKILPEIRRRVPGARFVVAGRNPAPAFVSTFADVQGMTFTGTVNDIRPFIAKAAVCVAPLRIGSGTRLKILEAAAMAKSVVSTRIGAEGLLLVPGEDIILADDADSFATSVAALLGDAPRRCAMGRSARARLERHYSRGALLGAIRQALTHIPPCPAKALRSIRGMPDRFTVRG